MWRISFHGFVGRFSPPTSRSDIKAHTRHPPPKKNWHGYSCWFPDSLSQVWGPFDCPDFSPTVREFSSDPQQSGQGPDKLLLSCFGFALCATRRKGSQPRCLGREFFCVRLFLSGGQAPEYPGPHFPFSWFQGRHTQNNPAPTA